MKIRYKYRTKTTKWVVPVIAGCVFHYSPKGYHFRSIQTRLLFKNDSSRSGNLILPMSSSFPISRDWRTLYRAIDYNDILNVLLFHVSVHLLELVRQLRCGVGNDHQPWAKRDEKVWVYYHKRGRANRSVSSFELGHSEYASVRSNVLTPTYFLHKWIANEIRNKGALILACIVCLYQRRQKELSWNMNTSFNSSYNRTLVRHKRLAIAFISLDLWCR